MRFAYYEPASLEEAQQLLGQEGARAAVVAGGTDLLLQMRRHLRKYGSVINIKTIPGLDGLHSDSSGLTIGALTTFRAIETDPEVGAAYPSLVDASRVVAGVQLRNLATIGGNIGNASPSADSVPPLVALGASVTIVGPRGDRALPIEDCFAGPGQTTLEEQELIKRVFVPRPGPRSSSAYERFTPRSAMDIAVVGVAAAVNLDDQGRCSSCRIALGAVSPTPLRAVAAESVLRGERPAPALLKHAGQLASEAARPISDIRASADYRRALVAVMTERVLGQAFERAGMADAPGYEP